MKYLILLILSIGASAQTTYVTMTRHINMCTPAGGVTPVPVLAGSWVATGCLEVYAYKYGNMNTSQQFWGCSSPTILEHINRGKGCTCFDDFAVASTMTASKSGNVCKPLGNPFPDDSYCDF